MCRGEGFGDCGFLFLRGIAVITTSGMVVVQHMVLRGEWDGVEGIFELPDVKRHHTGDFPGGNISTLHLHSLMGELGVRGDDELFNASDTIGVDLF